jgi:hypothetical protein
MLSASYSNAYSWSSFLARLARRAFFQKHKSYARCGDTSHNANVNAANYITHLHPGIPCTAIKQLIHLSSHPFIETYPPIHSLLRSIHPSIH